MKDMHLHFISFKKKKKLQTKYTKKDTHINVVDKKMMFIY